MTFPGTKIFYRFEMNFFTIGVLVNIILVDCFVPVNLVKYENRLFTAVSILSVIRLHLAAIAYMLSLGCVENI